MAAAGGINAVRLPVGYWALATTADEAAPFIPGAWACIDAALDWGFRSGIGELAPGDMSGDSHGDNGLWR